MDRLYISKAGEVRTKAYWMKWGESVFNTFSANIRRQGKTASVLPINMWERTSKVLQLTPYKGD